MNKKYAITYIFIILRLFTIKGSDFDFHQLKGLYTIFNQDNVMLSPIEGAYLYETQQLEDFYNTQNPEQQQLPEYTLIHNFFHILEVAGIRESLKVNQKAQNWALGLNGTLVGEIIGYLQKDHLTEHKETIATRWKAQCVALHSEVKLTVTNCCKTLDLIQKSYIDNKMFTVGMLTAILYLKRPIDKKEMIDYLVALQSILGDGIFTERLTETKKDLLLTQVYSDEELLKIANKEPIHRSFHRPEQTEIEEVIAIGHFGEFEKIYPRKIVNHSYGFKGQIPVANCVEATLNDLLNIICYDTSTNKFNLGLFPENVQNLINKDFKAFYAQYNNPQKTNCDEYQQIFFNLVSNIPGIEYYEGKNYAIDPTVQNMLYVINFLLGTHAETWNDLDILLSTPKRKLTFFVTNHGTSSIIHITINDTSIKLNVTPRHSSLEYPERSIAWRNFFKDDHILPIIRIARHSLR